MRARWMGLAWGLVLSVGVGGPGCEDNGDDDDMPFPVFDGGGRGPLLPDAGPLDAGPLDAGVALVELGLAGERLVSELTPDEVQQLCRKLDEVTALVGDLQQACTVEAYLLTYDVDECESIVGQCTDNGATVLGLEAELPCSLQPVALKGCDAPISDVLACAVQLGDFWAGRACETALLADLGPLCPRVVAQDCPVLFGGGQ
jgi:hypothetical protein